MRGHDPVTQRPLEIVGKGTRRRPWGGTREPRRCWPQAGAVLPFPQKEAAVGERVSRSRTRCLGCRLVLAPGISQRGGVGEEGEGAQHLRLAE